MVSDMQVWIAVPYSAGICHMAQLHLGKTSGCWRRGATAVVGAVDMWASRSVRRVVHISISPPSGWW